MLRRFISGLLCSLLATTAFAEADAHHPGVDGIVKTIKNSCFERLFLTTKILPNNAVYVVETAAIEVKHSSKDESLRPELSQALLEPELEQPPIEANIANDASVVTAELSPDVELVEEPLPTKSAPIQSLANDSLISILSEQELLALRKGEAKRVKLSLEYQPHPSAPRFAVIPTGRFKMGDLQGDGDFDEGPVRELQITKVFGMSVAEVSFDLWLKCIEAEVCSEAAHLLRGGDQGWGRGSRPVINVSWAEIQYEFIPWLNELTNQQFRLPTEAEWEYAARAGSDEAYSFGSKISHDEANFGNEKCCGGAKQGNDKWEFTAPVAELKPNAFGLYDMHGNVYEWVFDCYSNNYEALAGAECADAKRVARGGSWYDAPESLRSANRVKFSENFRIIYLGFRLVHVIE